jgi:arginyl-tRNA synthetase
MHLEDVWAKGLRDAARDLWKVELPPPLLEPPSDPKFGDATCSAPMRLAKELRKAPRMIADELARAVQKMGLPKLSRVEVAGAGYINLTAAPEFHAEELARILSEGADYGRSTLGAGRRVLVEHCSANPTGPLHIAHGRQAAVGDSIANILDYAGYQVAREFYINDTGNQIEMLGRSIRWRILEGEGRVFQREERGYEVDEKTKEKRPLVWLWTQVDDERFEIPENNAYKGDYIKSIAAELRTSGRTDLETAKRFGVSRLLGEIRKDLETFRVRYDAWQSEEELHRSGKVDELLNYFKTWGYTYSKDGALYAKFKDFGDTEDRPLVKKDGSVVYRLPDIAYHKDKFDRGFDTLIDLWGPDHHAHIANVAAGLRMRNFNLVEPDEVRPSPTLPPEQRPVAFKVLLIQHCTLFQGGVEVKMSKRAASYVTLRELMEEVGVDATRFFFAMRKPSSHLDFDMDVAKQQSKDNPYYYAGYAHARICNIYLKGIEEKKVDPADLREGVWHGAYDGTKIGPDEIVLLKMVRHFRRRLEIAARDLDPAVLAEYLRELSGAYQSYYEIGNHPQNAAKRVLAEDEGVRRARLAVGAAVQQVLRNGFRLLGLSAPERM